MNKCMPWGSRFATIALGCLIYLIGVAGAFAGVKAVGNWGPYLAISSGEMAMAFPAGIEIAAVGRIMPTEVALFEVGLAGGPLLLKGAKPTEDRVYRDDYEAGLGVAVTAGLGAALPLKKDEDKKLNLTVGGVYQRLFGFLNTSTDKRDGFGVYGRASFDFWDRGGARLEVRRLTTSGERYENRIPDKTNDIWFVVGFYLNGKKAN